MMDVDGLCMYSKYLFCSYIKYDNVLAKLRRSIPFEKVPTQRPEETEELEIDTLS